MTNLSEHAAAQAERDVGAKVLSNHTPRVAGLAWFLNQRLRVQFLITAVALFLVYAAVAGALHATGLRIARAPEFQRVTCNPTAGTAEERTACKIKHEQAAKIAFDAERTKTLKWVAEYEADKAALTKERRRQRSVAAKREFDERLIAIASGQHPVPDRHKASRLNDELTATLLAYLQGIEHPMAAVEYDYHADNVRPVLSRKDADDTPSGPEGLHQADRVCAPLMPPQFAPRCAQAVIADAPRASFSRGVRWIEHITYAVDLSRRPKAAEAK